MNRKILAVVVVLVVTAVCLIPAFTAPHPAAPIAGSSTPILKGNWSDIDPSVSHGGGTLAYVSDQGERSFAVWIVSASGSDMRRLTSSVNASSPEWSYNNKMIGFISSAGNRSTLEVVTVATDNVSTVPGSTGVQNFTWANSKLFLAFTSTHGIYTYVVGEKSSREILSCSCSDLVFLPNDSGLVFSKFLEQNHSEIDQMLFSSTNVTTLVSLPGFNIRTSFNPQGNQLAWLSNATGGWGVWLAWANGGDYQDLSTTIPVQSFQSGVPISLQADNMSDPVWSPDGSNIAFSVDLSQTPTIFVVDTNFFVLSDQVHGQYSGPPGAVGTGVMSSANHFAANGEANNLGWITSNAFVYSASDSLYILTMSLQSNNPYVSS